MRGSGVPATRTPPAAGILFVLALLTAAAPLSVDIYTPSLPLIQHELAATEWLTQASITACLLGIGIGQLFWGPLSDRAGRRPVILAGVIGWTITSAISAMATTPEMLVTARGAAGLCGAAGIVVARSVVRDISVDRGVMASRVGLLSLITSVAPVIAPVMGAAIAHAWGWRADFLALTAFGAAIGLATAITVPETLAPDHRSAGDASVVRSLLTGARNAELAFVAIALAAHAFGFYAYITTLPFIVELQFGHPPVVFAVVFASNAAAMLAANLGFRRLVRHHRPALPLGIGLSASTLSGVTLFAASLAHGPEWLLWTTSTVFAAAAGFVLPAAHSWGQLTLVASGAASALTGSAQFLGGVLGSPVTGVIGPTAAHLGLVIATSSALALLAWYAARIAASRSDPDPCS
ncbi:MFS transporter [Agromyces sp. Soil535]|uniref:MFS transporter n=1 Tax=Agromyces sp. Soil535 TaxID=1736390 RepID=UPI0006F526FC|nr:MFS transporter [Agromyces sp. Soil535]KRE23297.1 hypothetical protein ASG80_06090 [Agromyces sp. Soil535]